MANGNEGPSGSAPISPQRWERSPRRRFPQPQRPLQQPYEQAATEPSTFRAVTGRKDRSLRHRPLDHMASPSGPSLREATTGQSSKSRGQAQHLPIHVGVARNEPAAEGAQGRSSRTSPYSEPEAKVAQIRGPGAVIVPSPPKEVQAVVKLSPKAQALSLTGPPDFKMQSTKAGEPGIETAGARSSRAQASKGTATDARSKSAQPLRPYLQVQRISPPQVARRAEAGQPSQSRASLAPQPSQRGANVGFPFLSPSFGPPQAAGSSASPRPRFSGRKIRLGIETEFVLAAHEKQNSHNIVGEFVNILARYHNWQVPSEHPRMWPSFYKTDLQKSYNEWAMVLDVTNRTLQEPCKPNSFGE